MTDAPDKVYIEVFRTHLAATRIARHDSIEYTRADIAEAQLQKAHDKMDGVVYNVPQDDKRLVNSAPDELATEAQRVAGANLQMINIIQLAHEYGWNGVDNSKLLDVFLRGLIDRFQAENAELKKRLDAYEAATRKGLS